MVSTEEDSRDQVIAFGSVPLFCWEGLPDWSGRNGRPLPGMVSKPRHWSAAPSYGVVAVFWLFLAVRRQTRINRSGPKRAVRAVADAAGDRVDVLRVLLRQQQPVLLLRAADWALGPLVRAAGLAWGARSCGVLHGLAVRVGRGAPSRGRHRLASAIAIAGGILSGERPDRRDDTPRTVLSR